MWRLSWSQFSMHDRCPFEWYAKYKMKLVPYEKKIYFIFGSAVHLAIETFLGKFGNGISMTVVEMLGVFKNYLNKEGVKDPDTLQYQTLQAMNCFNAWRQWFSSVDFQVVSLECKRAKDSFSGIVDCECVINGQKYIVDWKTSSRKYSQKKTDGDGQLTAYLWLTGSMPKDVHVAQGVLVKGVTQFQFLESRRKQADIDNFLENLQNMRNMIQSYKSPEDPEKQCGDHCKWCDIFKLEKCEGMDDF